MSDIKYLVGDAGISNTPMEPYCDKVCSFAADLSAALMRENAIRLYPDIMSFAFWCRKSNIQSLKERFLTEERRLGRGLVFHVAPSNVPINFAFTYLFSLLAGNANIVRVPSRPFPQILIVCEVLNRVLEDYQEIKKGTAFVSYPADNVITEMFCQKADARVIWGGDATVQEVRKCNVKPRCIDLVFADRYSFCIIDAEAVNHADTEEMKKLAEAFYNDTYLMDQNACSSPQIIFWRNATSSVRSRFWKAIVDYTKTRYQLQAASVVDKYTQMCQDAVSVKGIKRVERKENILYCAELESLPEDVTVLRGHCGYFYEYNFDRLEELANCITEKYQTVTYYGIESREIQAFVLEEKLRGIDRIVPVGKALDIGVIWDGYDIVRMLSRIIDVM